MKQSMMTRILKPGVIYFALAFGAGFVLGTIRVLWAVPALGERAAELLEMPVMFIVILLGARWIVRRFAVPAAPVKRLGIGIFALTLLLVMEFGVVLWLRGLSLREYFASRDAISGTAYFVMLIVFAVMPLLVARKGRETARE